MTRTAIVVATCVALSSCGQPPAREPAVAAAAPALWRTLGAWSGRGGRQTGSFDVASGALRLRWQATGEAGASDGHLTVTLHSAISGRALQTIVDHRGTGSGTAELQDEPRVSYLDVASSGLDWTLTLEEATYTPPTAPSGR